MNTPIEFEKIVKDLYATKFVDGFEAFHNKKYHGKRSGHEHQIDFALEGMIADLSILVLGECKQYSSPVSLDRVMAFAYRVMDISAQKGILVSSSGFQAGAFKIAQSASIALVVCRNQTLTTELARSTDLPDNEPVNAFLGTITFPSPSLQYALLMNDEECHPLEKSRLLNQIIVQ